MKTKLNKFSIGMGVGLLIAMQPIFADTLSAQEQAVLQKSVSSKKIMCTTKLACSSSGLITKFYTRNNYTPVWIEDDELTSSGEELIATLNKAYREGLDPTKYHVEQINNLVKALDDAKNSDDKVKILTHLEVTLTDAFFLYATDLNNGLVNVKKSFPYWTPVKTPLDLITFLNNTVKDSNPQHALESLDPKYPQYNKLKAMLAKYQDQVIKKGNWKTIPVGDDLELGSKGDRVYLLQQRLLASGELDSINSKGKFTKDVQNAVVEYQTNNGLYPDGVVDKDTLAALNISIANRIRQIELNMDRMRLLPADLDKQEYIMVNIPSYSLSVMNNNSEKLAMDVVAGAPKHPSCILNSKISYLVINPYWNIPPNIAAKEVLPGLRQDPNFLTSHHMQMLAKGSDGQYKVISSSGMNWNAMSVSQFNSYRYRQSPGPTNTLGKVKFMFPNACQIYLHDSNEPDLFDVYKRDFSHGCVRLSRPMDLADYILGKQKDLSDNQVKNMFDKDNDHAVTLTTPVNLYLVYLTSWVDDNGVQFRKDIYHLDNLASYPVMMPASKIDDSDYSDQGDTGDASDD